jgi:Mg2+ and Co2+ transporter CorA
MVRRGSVTVTHTDDNDYGLPIYSVCSEEQTLQSGMMLNHCILYREISFKTFHLKAFGFTKDLENKTAYIAITYNPNGSLKETIIPFGQAISHINSVLSPQISTTSSSSCLMDPTDDDGGRSGDQSPLEVHSTLNHSHSHGNTLSKNFIWIHLVDKQCLSLLVKKLSMPSIAINAFMDVIPRTTFNVFKDQSILLTVTSFCRHDDGIICSVKVCCFIKKNIIVIQERRTHASIQEISNALSTLSSPKGGGAGSSPNPLSPHSISKPFDFAPSGSPAGSHRSTNATGPRSRHRLSEAQSSLGTSLRHVLHSLRASHVTEAETKEATDGPHGDGSGNGNGPYSGRVYVDLKQKLSSLSAWNQLNDRGMSYILYELIYTMLEMTTPVISFYSQRQLTLHDSVYVREEPPTHTEGNAILDRVDFIKAGFQLMENLTERSTLCLVGNREKLTEVMPEEYVSDVISSYEHALDVITDMHAELSRITDNINGIITRRNEQISIVLSLVATVFLPLTFIAGVFGMNFSNGGVLVYMLDAKRGENYFWGSCAACVLLCVYIFISKGWIDMLGKVRRGGQSSVTDGMTMGDTSSWLGNMCGNAWNSLWNGKGKKESRIASED